MANPVPRGARDSSHRGTGPSGGEEPVRRGMPETGDAVGGAGTPHRLIFYVGNVCLCSYFCLLFCAFFHVLCPCD